MGAILRGSGKYRRRNRRESSDFGAFRYKLVGSDVAHKLSPKHKLPFMILNTPEQRVEKKQFQQKKALSCREVRFSPGKCKSCFSNRALVKAIFEALKCLQI